MTIRELCTASIESGDLLQAAFCCVALATDGSEFLFDSYERAAFVELFDRLCEAGVTVEEARKSCALAGAS